MSVEELLRRWQAVDPRRTLVCRSLQAAAIRIDHIHETDDPLVWGLYVRLPQSMAELFATQREILVWATFRRNSNAAALQEAFDLLGHQVRLSKDVLLALCLSPAVAKELSDAAKQMQTIVAVLPEAALYNCKPQGNSELIDVLRPRLYSRDLYDHKPPVTRSGDFFGRNKILSPFHPSRNRFTAVSG